MNTKTYRLTGVLYLLVIICAGVSQGYVRGTLVIPGDASATATNILQNTSLFRLGLSLDLGRLHHRRDHISFALSATEAFW